VFPGDLAERVPETAAAAREAKPLGSAAPDASKEASDVSGVPLVPSVPELVGDKILELEEALSIQEKQRKLHKSAVRLLSVYDDCCRLIRPVDYRAAPTAYINKRCDALVGRTVAEALASSFVDNTGASRPYRRRDLDYDIKAKRLAIHFEGPTEDLPIAEEAHMACLHAVQGSESSAFYTADVQDRIHGSPDLASAGCRDERS
jgi:hypothetical protein